MSATSRPCQCTKQGDPLVGNKNTTSQVRGSTNHPPSIWEDYFAKHRSVRNIPIVTTRLCSDSFSEKDT